MNEPKAIGHSPAGVIEAIPGLQDRTKAIYWRQVNGEWQPTRPLPADATGREQYLAKGFRLSDPTKEPEQAEAATDSEKESLYAELAELRAKLAQAQTPKGKKVKTQP